MWLTLIGLVNSAIGAYYYLRIIVVMYMREARKEVPVTTISFGTGTALAISVIATLYLGLHAQSRSGRFAAFRAGSATPNGTFRTLRKTPPSNPIICNNKFMLWKSH